MISYKDISFSFDHMGLFYTDKDWIHPSFILPTYEIIYLTNGTAFIEEEDKRYIVNPKDLLILEPNKIHKGFKYSKGITSFYWVHFTSDTPDKLNLPKFVPKFDESALFKELLHYGTHTDKEQFLLDSILSHIIARSSCLQTSYPISRSAREILEWTRINASAALTVNDVANHFNYTPEHISRIMKTNYNKTLKTIITEFIIKQANDLLCNSNHSIKEIADILSFDTDNAFIKFYKYHEHISPNKFRNKYSFLYMNN